MLVPTDFLDEQEVEVVVTVDGADVEGEQQRGAQDGAAVEVEVEAVAVEGREVLEWDGGARTWHVVSEVRQGIGNEVKGGRGVNRKAAK